MNSKWIFAVVLMGVTLLGAGCRCPMKSCEKQMKDGTMHVMLSGILDGQTYEGEVELKGESKAMKDTLIFRNGNFRSTACDQYHFGYGSYLAIATGDVTAFQAQTWNPEGATIVWKGTIEGGTLTGTMTLHEKGKMPVEHWVKATRMTMK